ncbi:YdcF family protein, partial [Planctomycetota bacterium]
MFLLYIFSIPLVENCLLYSLECRYEAPSTEVLSTLHVIVILGAEPRCAYLRLHNGVNIFKQSGARILAVPDEYKAVATHMSIQDSAVICQAASRNTMEDAVELVGLIPPGRERRIGIVTCALHMLRAEWAFRKQFPHDVIVPIPVGYRYVPPSCRLYHIVPSAA